jgi:hypothetical protein
MKSSATKLVAICGATWMSMAASAGAQNLGGYFPQSQNQGYNAQNYNGLNSPTYTPPAVSPYLNLGVNANGLSNYQTLVKPMMDEQDSLQRQSANLQKLQRQVRDSQGRRDSSGNNDGRQPQSRFMNYSHYYGGIR